MPDNNSKKKDAETNPFLQVLKPDDPESTNTERLDLDPAQAQSPNINLLQNDDKRMPANQRIVVDAGYAIVYDLQGKIISKAVLRNLSPGGAGVEVHLFKFPPKSIVMVEFGGEKGAKIGPVKCSVQWVAAIEHHPHNHKMIGLQFMNLTPSLEKSIKSYFEELKRQAGFWL